MVVHPIALIVVEVATAIPLLKTVPVEHVGDVPSVVYRMLVAFVEESETV